MTPFAVQRQPKCLVESRLALAALIAALLYCGVAAVPARAESLASVLGHSHYSASARQSIESLFRHFAAQGVPEAMLMPRLQQGIARRVPSHVVIGVLSRNGELLVRARGLLQTVAGGEHFLADHSAWSLSATILGGAGDASTIRALAQASTGSVAKYRSALVLFGALEDWGLDSKDILAVTLAAVRSSLPPAQYVSISEIFVRGRAQQIPPRQLARRLIEALPRSHSYEDLRQAVLY